MQIAGAPPADREESVEQARRLPPLQERAATALREASSPGVPVGDDHHVETTRRLSSGTRLKRWIIIAIAV